MSGTYSSFQRDSTRWLLQRVTAVFLLGVLAFHFLLMHFANHAADVTFLQTQGRMSQVWYFVVMLLFLVSAAFHGVNGVYNALVNQGLDGARKRVVGALLGVAGLLVVVQGIRVAIAMTDLL